MSDALDNVILLLYDRFPCRKDGRTHGLHHVSAKNVEQYTSICRMPFCTLVPVIGSAISTWQMGLFAYITF